MLAKTKPADLAANFGKLAVVTNQEFKKIRGEIRENSPVSGATILPLRYDKRKRVSVIDWTATTERMLGYWFYAFVFGWLGLLTLYAVFWALASTIVGTQEVPP